MKISLMGVIIGGELDTNLRTDEYTNANEKVSLLRAAQEQIRALLKYFMKIEFITFKDLLDL